MIPQRWSVVDEGGAAIVEFTSFLEINFSCDGQALSYPIEEGGFANYNKVQSPLEISVSLARQGAASEFSGVLEKLDKFQLEATKVFVVTPSKYYGPMTLESYRYTHSVSAGASLLVVDLDVKEVREVKTETTTVISSPKNPTSARKKDAGLAGSGAQTGNAASGTPKQRSALKDILG